MTATYEKVESIVLSSTQATVTFTSISGAYTDLVLVMNPIANTLSGSYPYLRFNGDSGSNYSRSMMQSTGSAAQTDRSINSSEGYFIYGNQVTTNGSFSAIVNIMNYSNTTTRKTFLSRTNVASDRVEALVGLWRSTSAITSITIYCGSNSFVSGATFTLYGIKAE
jgi:hypothetical protein